MATSVDQLSWVPYLHAMDATVQDDGKIAIPKVLRDALGLDPGTVVDLQQQAGALVARKKTEPDVFEKWRGRGQLPAGTHTDEYLRLTRDGDRR
jgi:bifunctional DNA-binding transcriptional regulator/antitoxin component of YhaV-PrlF toxin-antitoxin module